MHELSIMNQIVGSVITEAEKNGASEVTKIFLEIGELTFLGAEQLRFAFDVLKNVTLLKNAVLMIEIKKAAIRCDCGYRGDLDYSKTPEFHQIFPVISCPVCGAVPSIIAGKECIIRNITMEVPDVQVS